MTPALPPVVEALDAACAPLVAALGRQSLYAAVALALALPAARLLRRSPARVQAALWALVLLRLVLPPGLAAPWSLRSLLLPQAAPATVLEAPDGVAGPPPGTRAPALRSSGAAAEEPLPGVPWSLLLACGWVGGVAATAARLGRRRRRFRLLLRRAVPVRDPDVLARLESFRRRLGIGVPVGLRAGGGAAPPFTLGVLRPAVHVPAALLEPARRAALDAALAHELAHVRARDDLRLRLRSVVQALFFFHPGAWLAGARHAEARELAADERVVGSGSLSARAYGRGFAAAARLGLADAAPSGALAAPTLRATRRGLVVRLERILSAERPGPLPGRIGPAALLAAGLLVLPMAAAAPAASSEPLPAAPGPARRAPPERFLHPVPEARLTSAFGERWNPLTGSRDLHRGLDLAAPVGTPVLAPASGTVRVATERYGPAEHLGTVVVLDHGGGLESLYSHLDTLAVAAGERVAAGQALGTVGATGDVTGPHLHFEVRRHGEAVDPAGYLRPRGR